MDSFNPPDGAHTHTPISRGTEVDRSVSHAMQDAGTTCDPDAVVYGVFTPHNARLYERHGFQIHQ